VSDVLRDIELGAEAGKDVAFCDTAGVAFVDGGAEGGEFFFVFAFVAFEAAEGGADDFARVFVAPGFDFVEDELVEFVGEVDVAGGHACCHVSKDCQWRELVRLWVGSALYGSGRD